MQVLLHIKVAAGGDGPGIFHGRVIPYDCRHPLVVVDPAARVGHPHNRFSGKTLQVYPVLLHLTDDLRLFQLRQMRMGQCMHSYLVIPVKLTNLLRPDLIVIYPHIFPQQGTGFSQQFGINVEGGF